MLDSSSTFAAPIAGGRMYYVREGDTLEKIARVFNVTVAAIMAANTLSSAEDIQPGQALTIPPPSMVLRVAQENAIENAPTPQVGVLGVGDANTPVVSAQEIQEYLRGKRTTYYVSRQGDTIARVAALFKVDALVLSQINQVSMSGELAAGTRLIVPLK